MKIRLSLGILLFGVSLFIWLAWIPRTQAQPEATFTTYLPLVQNRPSALAIYQLLLLSNRDGAMQLYTMRGDGQGLRRLSELPAKAPQWSPDGSQILFASPTASGDDLYLVNLDGTNHHALTTLPGDEFGATWASDGTQILFLHDDGATPSIDLYVVSLNDDSSRLIATNPALKAAIWSPSGEQIAYVADEYADDPTAFRYQVFVYTEATTLIQQVTHDSVGYELHGWVEKGKQLLISPDYSDDQRDLFVIQADGSNLRQFSKNLGVETVHAISSDGEQVAYSLNLLNTSSAKLYDQRIQSDATQVVSEQFCHHSTCGLETVAFAPNGNALLYVTWHANSATYRPSQLWLVHPQEPAPEWEAALQDVYGPLWVNDHTLIVHRTADPYDLFSLVPYIYDFETGSETALLPLGTSQSTVYGVKYLP